MFELLKTHYFKILNDLKAFLEGTTFAILQLRIDERQVLTQNQVEFEHNGRKWIVDIPHDNDITQRFELVIGNFVYHCYFYYDPVSRTWNFDIDRYDDDDEEGI